MMWSSLVAGPEVDRHYVHISQSNKIMKTTLDIKSIICGALLGAGCMFTIGAANRPASTPWEYSVEWISLDQGNTDACAVQLDSINKKGWELLSAQMFPAAGQDLQRGPAMVLRRRAK